MSIVPAQSEMGNRLFAPSWQDTWLNPTKRFIRTKPLGAFGAAILVAMVFCAIFAPIIAPEDPYKMQSKLRGQPPSLSAPLGRDGAGRDVLSRVIYGAQVSVAIGFGATMLSLMIKSTIGLVSAYRLGWTDLVAQRLVDATQAIPQLVVLLTAAIVLPRGLATLIILLGLLNGIRGSRVVRSAVLSIRGNDYITAAQAIGAKESRILLRHILPNVFAPIMVIATVNLGGIILTEASLSFLGLGLEQPTISWGQMLSLNGLPAMLQSPWIPLGPGVAISMAVFGINMLGDAMRDVLDPRLRGSQG